MKKISICIPVFNEYNYTSYCLEKFKAYPEHVEVIIVDNGSSDATTSIPEKHKSVVYHRNNSNLGFAKAVNQGYSISTGNVVLFLNNDVRIDAIDSNWLDELVKISESTDALVGPTGGLVDPQTFQFKYETNDNTKPINYMSGWCLAASKATWEKLKPPGQLGPFDSDTFVSYFEDTDLSFRAAAQNIPFVFQEVPLKHFGQRTSRKLDINKLYNISKEKFTRKWSK